MANVSEWFIILNLNVQTAMVLEGLQEGLSGLVEDITGLAVEHPVAFTGVVAGSTLIGLGALQAITNGKKTTTTRKRRKKKTSRGIRRDRKFISKQKHEIKRRRKRKPAKIYKKKGKYWSRKPLKRSKKPAKRKQKRFIKGSKEAKAFMAKLRRMRK